MPPDERAARLRGLADDLRQGGAEIWAAARGVDRASPREEDIVVGEIPSGAGTVLRIWALPPTRRSHFGGGRTLVIQLHLAGPGGQRSPLRSPIFVTAEQLPAFASAIGSFLAAELDREARP